MQSPELERARQGDADAFAGLFEALRPGVYAVATRLAGPDDADDVVMETYLRAWQALPGFNGRAALKSWLYRIAHNCAVDAIRRRQRRREIHETPDDDGRGGLEQVPDERPSHPGLALERDDIRAAVTRGLAALPAEMRLALVMRYSDGLSYGELAAATGVPIGTVMSRLFNGKRRLRAILAAQETEMAGGEQHA